MSDHQGYHGYQGYPDQQGYQAYPDQNGYAAYPEHNGYAVHPDQQQWNGQGYAPAYAEAPPVAGARDPGMLPPLWVMGGKNDPAIGPFYAPYAGGPPAPPYNVSPDKAAKILAMALGRPDIPVRLAIRRRLNVSYIIIGIPLWFNIYHDYVVFTDHHVIFSRRTLWTGIKRSETFAVAYDDIDYFRLQKGSWARIPHFGYVRPDGNELDVRIDKPAAQKLAWYFSAPTG